VQNWYPKDVLIVVSRVKPVRTLMEAEANVDANAYGGGAGGYLKCMAEQGRLQTEVLPTRSRQCSCLARLTMAMSLQA
jgi:hypothetical protein